MTIVEALWLFTSQLACILACCHACFPPLQSQHGEDTGKACEREPLPSPTVCAAYKLTSADRKVHSGVARRQMGDSRLLSCSPAGPITSAAHGKCTAFSPLTCRNHSNPICHSDATGPDGWSLARRPHSIDVVFAPSRAVIGGQERANGPDSTIGDRAVPPSVSDSVGVRGWYQLVFVAHSSPTLVESLDSLQMPTASVNLDS